MNHQINDIRFKALALNFRQLPYIGRAAAAFEKAKETGELATLLRFHGDEAINLTEELYFRDDMDFFIGYYAIVTAALLTGYVSAPAPAELVAEGMALLGNEHVARYYTEYYPLILPQVFKTAVLSPAATGKDPAQQELDRQFELLLLLLRSRMKDEDIDSFLFLLDDGAFRVGNLGWVDIARLWDLIGDNRELQKIREEPVKYQQVLSLISGFSKFINYLNEYAALLKRASYNPLWHAVAWELEGYWFTRLKTKSGDTLKQGLQRLGELVRAVSMSGNESNEPLEEWQSASAGELVQAGESLNYLMQQEHQSLAQHLNL